MQRHYSTVNEAEVRTGLAKVIDLAQYQPTTPEPAMGDVVGHAVGSVVAATGENRVIPWWATLGLNQWLQPCEGGAHPLPEFNNGSPQSASARPRYHVARPGYQTARPGWPGYMVGDTGFEPVASTV